jgi:hypothetical protein
MLRKKTILNGFCRHFIFTIWVIFLLSLNGDNTTGINIGNVASDLSGDYISKIFSLLHIPENPVIENNIEGCSVFAFSHSDRGPVLGKTLDRHHVPDDPQATKIFTVERIDYSDSYDILICDFAVLNDQGLAIGDANAHYTGTENIGDGKGQNLAPLVARYCPDVESAIDFIKDYRITDDGRHFCLVDKTGKAASVEKGPGDLFNVRWGDSTGYVFVTNTSPDSVLRNRQRVNQDYQLNSDSRYINFQRILLAPEYQLTFESAQNLIFNHDSLGAICQHQENYPWQWSTRTCHLILPAEGKYYLAAKAKEGDSYKPCENEWRVFEFETATTNSEKSVHLSRDNVFLFQNYPNPFNPLTTISYSLNHVSTPVKLKIIDILGIEVETLVDEYQNPGEYSIDYDASNLSSGTYFYQLHYGSFIQTKRMTLVR